MLYTTTQSTSPHLFLIETLTIQGRKVYCYGTICCIAQ